MGSTSKLQGMITDRISELPHELLSQILSSLPRKYAFRTTILSKRWKKYWASVPELDFVFEELSAVWAINTTLTPPTGMWKKEYLSDHVDLLKFVHGVLSLRDSSDIWRLRLHCYCRAQDVSLVASWIRTAIRHNVVELDLRIKAIYKVNEDGPTLELPKCVFLCTTLVDFKVMSNCITYAPPTSGCFPSLKSLDVKVEYPRDDSMEKLFSCCPVLQVLSITGIVSDVVSQTIALKFKVSAPELKMLKMSLFRDYRKGDGPSYSISINAPKLENIDIKHDSLPMYSFENVHSLVRGSVDLCVHYGSYHNYVSEHAPALLEPFYNVKHLSIAVHYLKEGCLPAFDKLRELKLVIRDCYYWDLLTEFLNKSPNLESLVIEHEDDQDCVDDYEEWYFECVLYSEDQWSRPESVPICLTSHLESIMIRGFKGYPHEVKVARYLLDNGKVLKKMTVENEFHKQLKQRKGSKDCELEFV
ncbi:hypothetical protein EV1_007890 [Malus domestica]